MELLCCGTGRQAHKYVKKYIAPLVSYSLVTKDFRYYHVVPQFIAATMEYLAWKLAGKDDRFRLFSMMLDEMKVTNVGKLDRNVDMIIGPGTQVRFKIFHV